MREVLRALFRNPPPAIRPTRHVCAPFVDTVPLPSPLLTELIALRMHTRHLGWLSSREKCPDQYRRLARAVLRDVLDGWRAQTDGDGSLEDLTATSTHVRGEVGPSAPGRVSRAEREHLRNDTVTDGSLSRPRSLDC